MRAIFLIGCLFVLEAAAIDECPDIADEVAEIPVSKNFCPKESAAIVDILKRRLFLCQDGENVRQYAIAIGQAGTGKTKVGDLKTPLGVYPLEKPRPSKSYGTFVPVGYPTPEQKMMGYTGSAIGIHGPERLKICDGLNNVATDWTLGCVALASDRLIDEFSGWMIDQDIKSVTIY